MLYNAVLQGISILICGGKIDIISSIMYKFKIKEQYFIIY